MKRSLRIVTVGFSCAAVLLAGCGGDDSGGDAAATTAAPSKVAATGSEVTSTTAATAATGTARDTWLYDASKVIDTGTQPFLYGPMKVNGATFDNSTYQNLSCTSGFTWDFDLNRTVKRLTATVGVSDNSLAADKVTVAVKGDDRDLGKVDVSLGKPAALDVDLTNVLRLRVAVTRTGGNLCSASLPIGTYVVLGDAKLTR